MGESEGIFKHLGTTPLFVGLALLCAFGLFIAPQFDSLQPLNLFVKANEGYAWALMLLFIVLTFVALFNTHRTKRTEGTTRGGRSSFASSPTISVGGSIIAGGDIIAGAVPANTAPAVLGHATPTRQRVISAEKTKEQIRKESERYAHLTARQKAILAFFFQNDNRYALHWLFDDHPDVEVLERLGHIQRQHGKGSGMTGYAYIISAATYDYFRKHFTELDNQEVFNGFESFEKERIPPFAPLPYP